MEEYMHDLGIGQDFFNKTQKRPPTLKENIGKLDFTFYIKFILMHIYIKCKFSISIEIRNSVHQKILRTKQQTLIWEKEI